MRTESLIAMKSSLANRFDVAACLPGTEGPASAIARTLCESKNYDPGACDTSPSRAEIRLE